MLLPEIFWLTSAILSLANWLMGERWLGELWLLAMGFMLLMLAAIGVRIAIDWPRRRPRERKRAAPALWGHAPPEPTATPAASRSE